jgi:pimeloyl-ACP methyl ester carboxylesterase
MLSAVVLLLSGLGWGNGTLAWAEDKTPAKEKSDKTEIPPPEDLKLTTRDGVELIFTYYPGAQGKESVPVVLLHMWKQNRNDYKDLATLLQSQGCAVVVPDLRGHGESTQRVGRRGEALKAASLPSGQFGAMVTGDMEAVKKFLWEKNNAGDLNIDKLCVVGAEMGASVALNFTLSDAADQDRNRVLRPEYQLGRFVKALVLISPELTFRGLPIRSSSANVIPDVSLLILVGRKDPKALEEAARLQTMFEKYHPEPTGENAIDHKTLFFGKLDSSLQGTKLLDPKFDVNVSAIIAEFIQRRLVKSEESKMWIWRERKFPHG